MWVLRRPVFWVHASGPSAVFGGWKAVSVAVLAAAEPLEGNGERTEAVLTVNPEADQGCPSGASFFWLRTALQDRGGQKNCRRLGSNLPQGCP